VSFAAATKPAYEFSIAAKMYRGLPEEVELRNCRLLPIKSYPITHTATFAKKWAETIDHPGGNFMEKKGTMN
jgi:hypothetical protein